MDIVVYGIEQKKLAEYLNTVPESYRDGNLLLAYYASFSGIFTPDMLYQLLATFNTYQTEKTTFQINYMAISDLLLSDLCSEISHELFEMDEGIQKYLQSQPSEYLGQFEFLPTKESLAAFTYQYAQKFYNHPFRKNIKDVLYWKALSILSPEYTGAKIAETLQKYSNNNETSIEEVQLLLQVSELEEELGLKDNLKLEYSRYPSISNEEDASIYSKKISHPSLTRLFGKKKKSTYKNQVFIKRIEELIIDRNYKYYLTSQALDSISEFLSKKEIPKSIRDRLGKAYRNLEDYSLDEGKNRRGQENWAELDDFFSFILTYISKLETTIDIIDLPREHVRTDYLKEYALLFKSGTYKNKMYCISSVIRKSQEERKGHNITLGLSPNKKGSNYIDLSDNDNQQANSYVRIVQEKGRWKILGTRKGSFVRAGLNIFINNEYTRRHESLLESGDLIKMGNTEFYFLKINTETILKFKFSPNLRLDLTRANKYVVKELNDFISKQNIEYDDSDSSFLIIKGYKGIIFINVLKQLNLLSNEFNFDKIRIRYSDDFKNNLRFTVGKITSISGINFKNSNLIDVNFSTLNISDCNFKNTNLTKVNFRNTNISDCSFNSADVIRTYFDNTRITGSSFEKANLLNSSFEKAAISDCIFEKANLRNSSFYEATISNCNFEKTKIEGIDFSDTEIINSPINTPENTLKDINELSNPNKDIDEVLKKLYTDPKILGVLNKWKRIYALNDGEIEEILQEGMINLYDSVLKGRFRGDSKDSTYLLSICQNIIFKKIKTSNKNENIDNLEDLPLLYKDTIINIPYNTKEDVEKDKMEWRLMEAISRLTEKERIIIREYYDDGINLTELGKKLGLKNANQAKKFLSRGRNRLKQIILYLENIEKGNFSETDISNGVKLWIQDYRSKLIRIYDNNEKFEITNTLKILKERIDNKKEQNLILIGKGGVGKTTFLRQLTFYFSKTEKNIPIYINLTTIREFKNYDLIDIIEKVINDALGYKLIENELSLAMDLYPFLIIIDHIDEITNKKEFYKTLSNQIRKLLKKKPNSIQFILSGRDKSIQDYLKVEVISFQETDFSKKMVISELKKNSLKYFEKIKSYILLGGGNEIDVEEVYKEVILDLESKFEDANFNIKMPIQEYVFSVGKQNWLNKLKERKEYDKQDIKTAGAFERDKKNRLTLSQKKNHLLSIGINKYGNGIATLNNAVRDAQAFETILKDKYGISNVVSLYDEAATLDNIFNAFDQLKKTITKDDNLIVYFSGHGDLVNNRGYWIPVDAIVDKRRTYLSNHEIKDWLSDLAAHHILVIADSCFSGALLQKGQSMDVTRYYAIPSRWVMTSGQIEVVPDGFAGYRSPFAKSLLTQLELNPKPYLSMRELWLNMREGIISNSKQTPLCDPVREVNHQGGEYYFIDKAATDLPPIPETPKEEIGVLKQLVTPVTTDKIVIKTPMDALKNALRKLQVTGKTKEAYELLMEKLRDDSTHMTTVYLRLADYKGLQNDIARGIAMNVPQRKAQINHALDYIIQNLEEKDLIV